MPIFKRSDKAESTAPDIVIDPNVIQLGDRMVKVRKVAVGQWRELFAAVNMLPELIMGVMSAPAENRAAYLFAVIDHALNDIVQVVSVLTRFEPEWIEENVAPDELMAYFTAVARVNDFGGLLKNVQGALKLTQTLDKAADAAMSAE
ncbi:hypothetical protein NST07_25655 [Paenibacillus sp. FSL L8-0340]|uniref:hypothetical protein n=1 Tax=Paenibacillus sp. FSL L8-0340 TaxID=2954685 RepID=UPI0031583223